VHWRSHRISSVGHWYGEKSWVGVYCARGRIVIGIGRERIASVIKHDYYERPVKAKREIEFDDKYRGGQWMGMGYFQSHNPTVGYVLLPIWVIWMLASMPVALAISKRLRKRLRSGSNLCVHCGYDLRGISGQCPECGREVPGPVRSALV
jgi:hypothetical protein